jgi:propionyl-CoA carboxylase beta chain
LKRLLSYLPQSKKENLPYELNDEVRTKLATIIPDNPNKPYDMHEVIGGIIDEDLFLKFIKIMPKIS